MAFRSSLNTKPPFSSGMLEREMKTVVTNRQALIKPLTIRNQTPVLEKKKLSEATVEKYPAEKKVKLQNTG